MLSCVNPTYTASNLKGLIGHLCIIVTINQWEERSALFDMDRLFAKQIRPVLNGSIY